MVHFGPAMFRSRNQPLHVRCAVVLLGLGQSFFPALYHDRMRRSPTLRDHGQLGLALFISPASRAVIDDVAQSIEAFGHITVGLQERQVPGTAFDCCQHLVLFCSSDGRADGPLRQPGDVGVCTGLAPAEDQETVMANVMSVKWDGIDSRAASSDTAA
jgi:hypothetical protein